jgi:hypothetical protein
MKYLNRLMGVYFSENFLLDVNNFSSLLVRELILDLILGFYILDDYFEE